MTRTFGIRRILLALMAAAVLSLGLCMAPAVRASAAGNPNGDCDDNAIIRCGFSSPAGFINKLRNDTSLKPIYAHYGLEPAEYDKFVTSAKPGTAYRDGRIVVDGLTVATNAKSIGRLAAYQGAGYFTTNIQGAGTFYGNTNDRAFAPSATSIPVTVLFDDKGVMQFAVLNTCGNPIYGALNQPTYSCNTLHKQAVAGRPGVYDFWTDASAGNGAKIVSVTYDFGDGATTAPHTNPGEHVEHIYRTSDTFTASVTVTISLPGNNSVHITSAGCSTTATVALPYYQCVQLAAATIGGSKYKYRFTASGKAGNGAAISSADFTFGDGSKQHVKNSGNALKLIAHHEYKKDGGYMAKVVLNIDLPGNKSDTVSGPNCARKVPVAIPYYACDKLTSAFTDQKNNKYSLTATANYGNGASFTRVHFDFGDSKSQDVKPTGTSATVEHQYAPGNTYKVAVTLTFNIGKTTQTAKCTGSIPPGQQITQECQPGVPMGSALCNCQYNAQLPANSPECVQALPNTGAGSFIGLFGAAVVAGFFIFRQFVYRKHAIAGAGITEIRPEPSSGPAEAAPVHPRTHRNAQAPLRGANYHQPHRFRPRGHHDSEE